MTKRKILTITGIRSDYFFSRPLFRAIDQSQSLELGLVVGGAHLTSVHGFSFKEVEADGFNIVAKLDTLLHSDQPASRLKGAANQLQLLINVVEIYRPDLLLAVGDREEPMMTALCGAYLNIPVAHYCAGDRGHGSVDSSVRQAVSDLSHVLLTTCEDSVKRLLKRGEEPWRVYNVGFTGLDRIRQTPIIDLLDVERKLHLPKGSLSNDFMVVIQHPISSQSEQAGKQMSITLSALKEFPSVTFLVSSPNTDAGNSLSRTMIETAVENSNHIFSFNNIPDELFINALRCARGLIGNSSLGVYEAPYLNLPVLNIGKRQVDRFHGKNMTFIDNNFDEIVRQIRLMLTSEKRHYESYFGDGYSSIKIVQVLEKLEINERLLAKKVTY